METYNIDPLTRAIEDQISRVLASLPNRLTYTKADVEAVVAAAINLVYNNEKAYVTAYRPSVQLPKIEA